MTPKKLREKAIESQMMVFFKYAENLTNLVPVVWYMRVIIRQCQLQTSHANMIIQNAATFHNTFSTAEVVKPESTYNYANATLNRHILDV